MSLIYEKQLKLSAATNKKFDQGEVVNLVQVDAGKVHGLTANISRVATLPFVLVMSFIYLYIFIGNTFLVSIVFFAGAAGANWIVGKIGQRL